MKDNFCDLFGTGFQLLECRFCHHSRIDQGKDCHAALEKDRYSSAGQKLVIKWGEPTGLFKRLGYSLYRDFRMDGITTQNNKG